MLRALGAGVALAWRLLAGVWLNGYLHHTFCIYLFLVRHWVDLDILPPKSRTMFHDV